MSKPYNPFLGAKTTQQAPPSSTVAGNASMQLNGGFPPQTAPAAAQSQPFARTMPTQSMYVTPPMTTQAVPPMNQFQAPPMTSAPPMTAPPMTAPPMTAPPMTAPPMTAPPMTAPPMTAPSSQATAPSNRYLVSEDVYRPASANKPEETTQYGAPETYYQQPALNASMGAPMSTVYETKNTVDPAMIPSTKFVQTSLEMCPNTPTLLENSGLCFSAYYRPLAPADYEDEIPVIPISSNCLVRCDYCRAYMNPFVTFIEGGRKWKCNLCYNTNTTPSNYYCDLDANGRRLDIAQHPELLRGQCEYEVSQEYMTRPPQTPTYFFAIDVSYQSITNGMLPVVCQAIKESLEDLKQKGDGISAFVGFLTFDKSVQLYSFNPNTGVEVHVVGDLEEPFLPVPTSLVVSVEEYYTEIEKLLDNLPEMYKQSNVVDSCLGSAIAYANSIMEDIGGKVLLFQACLPNIGLGKLHNRENINLYGTEKEKDLLNPVSRYFTETLAPFVVNKQFSYDLFVCSSQYTDVSTLATIPKYSGGQFYYYPNYNGGNNMSECLYNDIVHDLRRDVTWEAVFRIRAPVCGEIRNYYGNCLLRSNGLIVAPCVTSDSVFSVDFKLKENVVTPFFYIQAALLYTNSSKSRRIRVFTSAVPVTSLLSSVYEKVNCEAYINHVFRQAADLALNMGLTATREKLHQMLVSIVNKYAPHRDASSSNILPSALSFLPYYIMSLQKHPAFRGGNEIHSDMRTALFQYTSIATPELVPTLLQPSLYCLSTMNDLCGTCLEEGQQLPEDCTVLPEDNFILPECIPLSAQNLLQDQVYLLDDGLTLYLYFGPHVPSEYYQAILGIPGPKDYNLSQAFFPIVETPLNERIHILIDRLRQDRPYFVPLYIVSMYDQVMVNRFAQRLVNDKAPFPGSNYTYEEYYQLISGKSFY